MTRDIGREFIDQAFTDAIAWKAARLLLVRALPLVDAQEQAQGVDPMTPESVGQAILRFLDAHPERPPRSMQTGAYTTGRRRAESGS